MRRVGLLIADPSALDTVLFDNEIVDCEVAQDDLGTDTTEVPP